MQSQDSDKEFIYLMPPAYHFHRAVLFTVASKAFENQGYHYGAAQMKAQAVYELARGFESLAYQSAVPSA